MIADLLTGSETSKLEMMHQIVNQAMEKKFRNSIDINLKPCILCKQVDGLFGQSHVDYVCRSLVQFSGSVICKSVKRSACLF